MACLSNLPQELILGVWRQVDPKDIEAFALTSKKIYALGSTAIKEHNELKRESTCISFRIDSVQLPLLDTLIDHLSNPRASLYVWSFFLGVDDVDTEMYPDDEFYWKVLDEILDMTRHKRNFLPNLKHATLELDPYSDGLDWEMVREMVRKFDEVGVSLDVEELDSTEKAQWFTPARISEKWWERP